jgi:hypothetical protein
VKNDGGIKASSRRVVAVGHVFSHGAATGGFTDAAAEEVIGAYTTV